MAERASVFGSGELLIEAMRIRDDSLRRRMVSAILGVVGQRLPPVGYRHAAEVLSEIRRCHPGWLAQKPDRRPESMALARAKALWGRLARDPAYLPWGMAANAGLLHAALGSGREGQKARRALVAKHKEPDVTDMLGDARPNLEQAVAALMPDERHWRVVGGALWWDALRGDPQLADMKTWLAGYMRPLDELSRLEWMRFWISEVSASAVPVHVAELLAEYHQTDLGIGLQASNALDVLHVPYTFGLDLVITADNSFAKVLGAVRKSVAVEMADVRVFSSATLTPAADLRKLLTEVRQLQTGSGEMPSVPPRP
jgi:hypothetical protein